MEGIEKSLFVLGRSRKTGNLRKNVGARGMRWSWNQRLQSGSFGLRIKVPSQEECSSEKRAEAGVTKSAGRTVKPRERMDVCYRYQGESHLVPDAQALKDLGNTPRSPGRRKFYLLYPKMPPWRGEVVVVGDSESLSFYLKRTLTSWKQTIKCEATGYYFSASLIFFFEPRRRGGRLVS